MRSIQGGIKIFCQKNKAEPIRGIPLLVEGQFSKIIYFENGSGFLNMTELVSFGRTIRELVKQFV